MEHVTIKERGRWLIITADDGYRLADATGHSFKEIKILPEDITLWKVIKA